MYSHLPPNERRLAEQDHDESQRAREDNIIERFSDIVVYPTGPCPIGYVTTCCRWHGCGAIICVPARTERALCPQHGRIAAEQDRQAAEIEAQEEAERWDGMG
jgi:hypothetical protein